MSEWRVQVVQLDKIGKVPNSDTLSITSVHGAYPVIFKSGTFKPGDLAIHVPPDSLVDTSDNRFAWLADKSHNGWFRVRFIKLRGVPSYGFLVPLDGSLSGLRVGDVVHELLGVKKYDPGPCFTLEGSGEQVRIPAEVMVPHYDIEGLRKYESLFEEGEPVWISEKIHGANGRWLSLGGELLSGSRTRFRKDSVWNRMAAKYELERILSKYDGSVLYGEVFGPGIQDLTYGLKEPEVRFFDLYDTCTGRYLDVPDFAEFCERHSLPIVPTIKEGAFSLQECYALAEGTSLLCPTQVREGIVVKPAKERWDQDIGRVFLKLPGEGYLLRKEKPIVNSGT